MAETTMGVHIASFSDKPTNNTEAQQRELTQPEVLAMKAIKRYDPRVVHMDTYDEISEFGGGTLVLAEVYYPAKEGETKLEGPHEYMVVIRNGRGFVYNDWSIVLREGAKKTEFISRLAAPDFVTAALTFTLVIAYIILVSGLVTPVDHAVQALGAALTTVLGFWFGRQTK